MPKLTKRERIGRELLEKVYEAERDPRVLAEENGWSLRELAAWAGKDQTRSALAALRTLADTQTQLILSRYRLSAAAKLVSLATQEEDAELARKAAVDLLKLNLVPGMEELGASAGEPAERVDERRVEKALAALGTARDEEEGT